MKVVIFCAALLLAGPAWAEDVRDFSPNRPSRSDSPFTVPDGLIQIESDLVNYTHPGQVLQTLDPMVIYGLGANTDIETMVGGLVRQQSDGVTAESFGDVVVRVKRNLLGNDGGPATVAVIPYIKIPTAAMPVGNGALEGGVNAPALFALPYDVTLTVEPEFSILKAVHGNGRQASFAGLINAGRAIIGNLSGFVEIYGQTFTDTAASGPMVTFDYGLSYLVTKNFQIDVGANVGLNHATPALNVYTGVAFRF